MATTIFKTLAITFLLVRYLSYIVMAIMIAMNNPQTITENLPDDELDDLIIDSLIPYENFLVFIKHAGNAAVIGWIASIFL